MKATLTKKPKNARQGKWELREWPVQGNATIIAKISNDNKPTESMVTVISEESNQWIFAR